MFQIRKRKQKENMCAFKMDYGLNVNLTRTVKGKQHLEGCFPHVSNTKEKTEREHVCIHDGLGAQRLSFQDCESEATSLRMLPTCSRYERESRKITCMYS